MLVPPSNTTSPCTSVPDAPQREPDDDHSVSVPPASNDANTTASKPAVSNPAVDTSSLDKSLGLACTGATPNISTNSATTPAQPRRHAAPLGRDPNQPARSRTIP